jgi:diguanylate cyclase (GGDEF)-like protein/PAS domain S-box-containing protein
MIERGHKLTHGRRSWSLTALQPANLLYVLMIPPLWLALIAMVGLAERDIFAPYNRLRLIFFAAACVLTSLLIIGFFVSIRRRNRVAEREDLIARQKVHLDSALANMPEGLCMFDGDQRLIVCNQQYADLYELSKEQAQPGTLLRSILEHHNAIGNRSEDPDEFIARRLSAVAAGKAYQHINKLRDGRLILVTHRPMDDGGWVATHKDVTERVSREESIRLLFEGSPVPMWVCDRESLRFLAVNDAAVARYGYSREQFMAMTVPELRPAADRERFGDFLRSLELSQFSENFGQHVTSDGTKIDVSVSSRALIYAGRNARLTAIHDISKSKQVERELRRMQKFLDAIIEHVPAPILVKDVANANGDVAECRYTLVNRSFEELFGVSRAKIVGKTVSELYPKERADFIIAENNNALRSLNPITLSDHEVHTATNGVRLCTATTVAVRDDAQSPQILVTVLQDVTERNRTEQRIARMAHHDHLTNIANRKTFNDTLEAAIRRGTGCDNQFAILSLDLDGFKETNDTYGHLIGDALLCEVSRRLLRAAGDAFVARIGGDEFALIVDGGSQMAAPLAERLLDAFREEIRVEGRRIKTGATIGAAIYPNHGSDSKTLISNADIALYRAKAEVRGTVLFFDTKMGEQVRERRALQDALRSAVECQQLRLHYQPQKTMSGETNGFEALARWQDRHHGSVSPAVFIPIAEETGLIVPIGEWALREACREAASWRRALTVAVNVSPLQFRYRDLPNLVHSILLDSGLAPARLELEITESVFIDDFSRAVSILSRLKALGVRVALDDFGSGYSSLSYLHSFAFDKIKIDRTFVLDLEHNQHSMAIVRAVIDLGHSLDIPVLAEGVETAAQHAMLLDRGCDEVQGYLVGRPMPIDDYAELVGANIIARAKTLTAS